jgi:hypothetical protein
MARFKSCHSLSFFEVAGACSETGGREDRGFEQEIAEGSKKDGR